MRRGPLVVGTERRVWCYMDHPRAKEAVRALAIFADLIKSPLQVREYRITELSLWHACALGWGSREVLDTLRDLAMGPIPYPVQEWIVLTMNRWGGLVLEKSGRRYQLVARQPLSEGVRQALQQSGLLERGGRWMVPARQRGEIKRQLLSLGYPVLDMAGHAPGEPLDIDLKGTVILRPYQDEAVQAFFDEGCHGGSGVVVLPCGSGKTIVGLAVMARYRQQTLVLTSTTTAAYQWKREIEDKCEIAPDSIGVYAGDERVIKPVTISTYAMMTWKNPRGAMPHLRELARHPWGLVIYDEVHLVPAPIFRFSAGIQNCRRLGLTATLVREDGREADVFSLIGPKCFDLPWRTVEEEGWIARAECYELRVPLDPAAEEAYRQAESRQRWRIAATNPRKLEVAAELVARHRGTPVLVIGHYLDQLRELAHRLGAPDITGDTPERVRRETYDAFRRGEIPVLCLSRVANTAVDLPDARVAVELSGNFGSRQEEAQRLGRLLRPKKDGGEARLYMLVTEGTEEVETAVRRQQFLAEQGYEYRIFAVRAGVEHAFDGVSQ
ncbi:DNA repair helicase XPB [Kyrpidia spormannii]|uniref:Helicase n=1 Tax=Kyrpidia spormannii TaxID=2055160 RepID=A0ACA8Z8Z9_9BACL|nr:DNA repair helicase XPB [Kyrpidia spormannii]CAB3392100.1 Helicase [Kyrpidia spormannii]